MKIIYKIFIPILSVLTVVVLLTQTIFSVSVQRAGIDEEVARNIEEIGRAVERSLRQEDVDAATVPQAAFADLGQRVLGAAVFRVKVWNRDRMVVWSDEASLIGSVAEKTPLERALRGETYGMLADAPATEASEAERERTVFTFVPVKDRAGQVVYIIEAVSDFEKVIAPVRGLLTAAPYLVGATAAAVILMLFAINALVISRPVEKLRTDLRAVAGGQLDHPIRLASFDEFGVLAQDAEAMRGRLNMTVEELKLQEDRYRRIVEFSPQAIAVHRDEKFVFVNDAMVRLVGAPDRKALLGQPIYAIVHPDDRQIVRERVRREMSGEAAPLREERFIRFDGKAVEVEVAGIPFVFDGQPSVQIVVLDISERKRNEARTRELDDLKDAFIRVVSHQLRTPLNSIRWNLESILAGTLGALKKSQKEFLQATYDSDILVIRQVQDLMVALDIKEGRIHLQKETVAPDALLTEALEKWRKEAEAKDVGLAYEPGPVPEIEVDLAKIKEAFDKLIGNAVMYTPSGGRVKVSLKAKGGRLRFECADTGAGIPVAEQEGVFTRFFRASNASVIAPDASGLSLFIVKYYVEQHGGTIGFTSEEGKGSTFWFELPLA